MLLIKKLLQTLVPAINIFLCLEPAGEDYIDPWDPALALINIDPAGVRFESLSYSW